MRNTLSLFGALAMIGVLATGCTNMENKLGRGLDNSYEIIRMGELRRTMEQTALCDSPDVASTTGFIHGFDRSLARTGIGIYEVVTSPFPPYHPVFTDHFAVEPVYPDNYKPGLLADTAFQTDTRLGFSGGEVAPFVPGSRFRVFDAH